MKILGNCFYDNKVYPRYAAYAITSPTPAGVGIIPDLKNATRTTANPIITK